MTEQIITLKDIKSISYPNYDAKRNLEIYNKNRGLAGYKKHSYTTLAREYEMTSTRIGQIVTDMHEKVKQLKEVK